MANPTTNYGFVLPTSTDLVTDLPADFDVALQGVDTRLKALNPSTTLGDTDYASATANTNTRLAIGTTGQVLTVVGGVPAWSAPTAPAFVGCFLSKSATQTISTATATAITFDTEDIDTDGFHSIVSNTSRITIPSGKGGKYQVTPQVRSEANSTGRRIVALYKNGSIILLNQFEQVPSATGAVTVGNSFIISLVATDYIELYFTQTSGGNLISNTEGTYFGVEYLGA